MDCPLTANRSQLMTSPQNSASELWHSVARLWLLWDLNGNPSHDNVIFTLQDFCEEIQLNAVYFNYFCLSVCLSYRDIRNNEISWAIEDSIGVFDGMKNLNSLWEYFYVVWHRRACPHNSLLVIILIWKYSSCCILLLLHTIKVSLDMSFFLETYFYQPHLRILQTQSLMKQTVKIIQKVGLTDLILAWMNMWHCGLLWPPLCCWRGPNPLCFPESCSGTKSNPSLRKRLKA